MWTFERLGDVSGYQMLTNFGRCWSPCMGLDFGFGWRWANIGFCYGFGPCGAFVRLGVVSVCRVLTCLGGFVLLDAGCDSGVMTPCENWI